MGTEIQSQKKVNSISMTFQKWRIFPEPLFYFSAKRSLSVFLQFDCTMSFIGSYLRKLFFRPSHHIEKI